MYVSNADEKNNRNKNIFVIFKEHWDNSAGKAKSFHHSRKIAGDTRRAIGGW